MAEEEGGAGGLPNPRRRSFLQGVAGAAVAGAGVAGAGVTIARSNEEPSRKAVFQDRPTAASEIVLRINGKEARLSVEPRRTLLLALREDLGLTGTKKGCNMGQCGACTVLMDGEPVYACFMLAADAAGRDITTIEGLERNGRLHPVQHAFVEEMGSQCGACTTGMIMSGVALLNENPAPSQADVRRALSGVLCRCGNYANEIAAVMRAAEQLAGAAPSAAAAPLPGDGGLHPPRPMSVDSPQGIVARAPDGPPDLPRKRGSALDGHAKATGRARYAGDIGFHPDDPVRKPLYAKAVRSPYAHAEAASIDDRRASGLPGYRGMITHRDVPRIENDRHFLNGKARYVGDAVAAVCAEDQYTAQQAALLVDIDWRVLDAYPDAEHNLKNNVAAIHSGGPVAGFGGPQPADTPTIEFAEGALEAGFAEADEIVEGRYVMPLQCHLPIEPHCCTALWRDGRLTLWDSQQSVFHTREVIGEALHLKPDAIRVECEYLGGGFGGKCTDTLGKTLYQCIPAMLAMRTGRPVRYEYTLNELIYAEDTRNPFIIDVKTGVKRDGTITAIDCTAIQPTGGYASSGPAVVGVCGEGILSTYRCPNFRFRGFSVYTTMPVGGEMRGFGHPQAVYAREKHIDEVAAAIGMNPLEFRRKNAKRTGDPITMSVKEDVKLANVGVGDCLDLGARAIGWESWQPPESKSGRFRRGIGMRASQEHSGRGASDGLVWIDAQGRIHLPLGIGNIGSVAHTGVAAIAAEALGANADDLIVTWADTSDVAWDFVTDASRGVHCHGKAVYNACVDLKRQLREAAASALGEEADGLKLRDGVMLAGGGRSISVRDLVGRVPERTSFEPYFNPETDVNPLLNESTGEVTKNPKMALEPPTVALAKEIVARGGVVGLGHYIWDPSVQAWGAGFAEVEVDMETGQVFVLRLACAHDCGRVLYRKGADAQVYGGTIMGLGYGVFEELLVDPNTHIPVNATIHQLHPPTILDVPEIVPILVEAPVEAGPFGAKGLGENPMFNAAAAVGNAIYNATGIHIREIPYTWSRVHDALGARTA